jgi:hypothetical protein
MIDNEMKAARHARFWRLVDLAAARPVRIADAMHRVDPQLVGGIAAWPSPRRARLVADELRMPFDKLLPLAPRPDAPAVFALLVTAGAAVLGTTETFAHAGDTLAMRVTPAGVWGASGVDMAWGDGFVWFPGASGRRPDEAAGPLNVAELLEDGRGQRIPFKRLRAATGLGLLLDRGTRQDQIQISSAEGRTDDQREALALLGGRVVGQNATTTRVVEVPGFADPEATWLVFDDGDVQSA